MRAMHALGLLTVLIGVTRDLSAQDRGDAARPLTLESIREGERHPLAPNHRLETITLGGSLRSKGDKSLFVVTTKLLTVADGVGREIRWAIVVIDAGKKSTIDKTNRREFVVAAGSPKAELKREAEPMVVSLEEGARLEIRLLDNGDDLITVDVTFEELTVRESVETVNVRDKILAAPQQTARRVRSFLVAKLGSEVRVPLDGASLQESKRLLLLQVTRK